MTAIEAQARRAPAGTRFSAAVAASAMVVGLAGGVFIGSLAARPAIGPAAQAVTPVVAPVEVSAAAAQAKALATFKALATDIEAAESKNDRRGRIRLGTALHEQLTAETVGAVYLEQQRLESALAVARGKGDHHAMQMIHRQLDRLCGTKTVQAYLDFCS